MPVLTPESCRDTLFRQQYLREMNLVKTITGEIGHITYRDSEYFDLDTADLEPENREPSFMNTQLSPEKPKFREKLDWFNRQVVNALVDNL